MNIQHAIERLRPIREEIDDLRSILLERERASLDLTGDELESEVQTMRLDAARIRLHGLMVEHYVISGFIIDAVKTRAERSAA